MGIEVEAANFMLSLLKEHPEGLEAGYVYDKAQSVFGLPRHILRLAASRYLRDKIVRIRISGKAYKWILKEQSEVKDMRVKYNPHEIYKSRWMAIAQSLIDSLLNKPNGDSPRCSKCAYLILENGLLYCQQDKLGGQAFEIKRVKHELTTICSFASEATELGRMLNKYKNCKVFKEK